MKNLDNDDDYDNYNDNVAGLCLKSAKIWNCSWGRGAKFATTFKGELTQRISNLSLLREAGEREGMEAMVMEWTLSQIYISSNLFLLKR